MTRAVRREVIRLARQGQPHPDPAVSREAVAWARRGRHRRFVFVLPIIPVLLVSMFRWQPPPQVWLPILMTLTIGDIIAFAAYSVRYAFAPRVEVVNLRALVTADQGGPAPVTIHGRGRLNAVDLAGVVLVLTVAATALLLGNGPEPPAGLPPDVPPDAVSIDLPIVLCLGVTVIPPLAVLGALVLSIMAVVPRGRGPLVSVDRGGVTVPHLGLTLPWEQVAWVDVAHPGAGGRPSTAVGLWILPHDRRAITAHARPPRWRRPGFVYWLLVNRRALFLPADWMREPPEVIVGAAWRFWRERAASPATPGHP